MNPNMNAERHIHAFIWIIFYIASSGGLTIAVILYDATIGRLIEYYAHKNLRRVVYLPNEDTIQKHGKLYFYFLVLFVYSSAIGPFLALPRKRKCLVLILSVVAADILQTRWLGLPGLFLSNR
jgi:hypothetical protein